MTTFADQLKPLVRRLGTTEAAAICDVTPRSLQLWMSSKGTPCRAMQVGVLQLLSEAASHNQTIDNSAVSG